MSKLNRREFKELLTEWQSNFINEKTTNTELVDFKGMTSLQKDFVNEVPVDLNLYAIGDFTIKRNRISNVLLDIMEESESLYKKVHNGLILNKTGIEDIIEILDDLLNESDLSYIDWDGNIHSYNKSSNEVKISIKRMKTDLKELAKDSSGILLYFPRMALAEFGEMADGSINNIGNIKDPAVWKNSLSWELKHDIFHYFESVLKQENSYSYHMLKTIYHEENINIIIRNFVVPDQMLKPNDPSIKFDSSLGDYDNYATVVPYIRSLSKEKASKNNFVEECKSIAARKNIELKETDIHMLESFFNLAHECYEEVEHLLKDKILIQGPHI